MSVSCPSCGGALPLDARFAQVVACAQCRTLLVCDAERLRLAGSANVLPADGSLFAVGSEGTYRGRRFVAMGRARWRYSAGHWDEWAVRFSDDGATAWISEDGERITVEDGSVDIAKPPAHAALSPGRSLRIGTTVWRVVEVGAAEVEAIEGQLPREILPGAKLQYANLVHKDRYASLDYDAAGGVAFHPGHDVERSELGLAPTTLPERTVAPHDLRCACCAAPLPAPAVGAAEAVCGHCGARTDLTGDRLACPQCTVTLPLLGRRGGLTSTVTCPHCRRQFDLSKSQPVLLAAFTDRARPQLPHRLGDRFRLRGQDWRLAGHLRCVERWEGSTWTWDEFLLLPTPVPADARGAGYRWLVLEDGNYQLLTTLRDGPPWDLSGEYDERSFRHEGVTYKPGDDEAGVATLTWVEGEMPWVAQEGDQSRFVDFAAPPRGLCAEWTTNEIEWFSAELLPRAEVAAGFGLTEAALPAKEGPNLLEPYVRSRAGWEVLAATGMATLALIALLLSTSNGQRVAALNLALPAAPEAPAMAGLASEQLRISAPFTVEKAPSILELVGEAEPPQLGWIAAGAEVVRLNPEDPAAIADLAAPSAPAEFEFWHETGRDDGGPWSEIQRQDRALVVVDQPGTYALRAAFESSSGVNRSMTMGVNVIGGVDITRYYWLALAGVAAVFLGVLWIPVQRFHRQRLHPNTDVPPTESGAKALAPPTNPGMGLGFGRRLGLWGGLALGVGLATVASTRAWGIEPLEKRTLSVREESARGPGGFGILRTRLLGGGLHHGK